MATGTATSKTLSWVQKLVSELCNSGYNIQFVDSLPLPHKKDWSQNARFFITCDPQIAQACRSSLNLSQKVIVICDTYLDIMPTVADFSLPNDPDYVSRQLHALLAMDQTNVEAHAHTSQLADTLHKRNEEIELIKNAIVRNVSHELKTPLLQVKSAVSLMAEDSANADLTNYAKNAMARLELLVKNITLLGTVLEINLTPVILRDVLSYARRTISRSWQYQDASTRIQIECQDNISPVLADKQGLSTVLQLLLDNALKFSDGEVKLIATEDQDTITISVHDHGIGIIPEEIEAIFQPFYQADSSSTRPYGGAGIGLAVVQLILQHHNSQITVVSQLGAGSTFSFKLKPVNLSDNHTISLE